MNIPLRACVIALAAGCAPLAARPATVSPIPSLPAYGQAVQIQLGDTEWPQYLPATRFMRFGTQIVVDYEYISDGFGPTRPDFGYKPVPIGELVPGRYTLQARLYDIGDRDAPPQTVMASFAVAPPADWGVYLVPTAPQAWEAASVLVHSAAYFEPESMRVSVTGDLIRIDFDYAPDAPVGGPAQPGLVGYAAVGIDGLAPGAYRIEAWGRPRTDGRPTKFFTREFTVGMSHPVFEYYHEVLGHYFMAGGPDEVKLLDAGGQGGWKRTGQRFKAWLRQADAPPNARPVCRFYARGPNSHFFTADAFECQSLKDLEQKQRPEAAATGAPFLGWGYEAIGFWALMPQDGQCPADAAGVFRAYNDRAASNDSNHRFMLDGQLRDAMAASWIDEGMQLCSPLAPQP
jgi:hypothetical protein